MVSNYIKQVAEAMNIDVSQQVNEWRKKKVRAGSFWLSSRDRDPISKFEDLEELLAGAFPQVFMLGVAFRPRTNTKLDQDDDESSNEGASTNRGFTSNDIKHILLQFTSAAATSRELLFYLFDHQVRHLHS